MELNSQTADDSVMGDHSESNPQKDELMPLPDLQKPKRKPQEVQFTTPSKRAVHLAGKSDSDEELDQTSVHSMDTDPMYFPGDDSDSADSPMSLSSLGVNTRTHHLGPPPQTKDFLNIPGFP